MSKMQYGWRACCMIFDMRKRALDQIKQASLAMSTTQGMTNIAQRWNQSQTIHTLL